MAGQAEDVAGTAGRAGRTEAIERVRGAVLDQDRLVRAIATGRRTGEQPRWRRLEMRYVDLKGGRRLQITKYDDTQAFTSNHAEAEAAAEVDRLLAEPFASWHVDTVEGTVQVRTTKKGRVLLSENAATSPTRRDLSHDRAKDRLLPIEDPVLRVLGITDDGGRLKPSRQAKYRQVEELVRALDAALGDAFAAGVLVEPTEERPLRVVDLGCGNAYLTFAAHRYLSGIRQLPTELVGVDTKAQSLQHNTAVADELGVTDRVRFVQGAIGELDEDAVRGRPDVVLALHACDTATDDALAQAVRWHSPLVLAAPCCHHDVAAQLRKHTAPAPYSSLVRDGILRERFADTLTDALRAAALRLRGYRVDVVEFVESKHTPRNTLIRAVRTGATRDDRAAAELEELTTTWRVRPRLQELLAQGR